MTDREMLMLAYGALKAGSYTSSSEVVKIIEAHLFGDKKPEIKTEKSSEQP